MIIFTLPVLQILKIRITRGIRKMSSNAEMTWRNTIKRWAVYLHCCCFYFWASSHTVCSTPANRSFTIFQCAGSCWFLWCTPMVNACWQAKAFQQVRKGSIHTLTILKLLKSLTKIKNPSVVLDISNHFLVILESRVPHQWTIAKDPEHHGWISEKKWKQVDHQKFRIANRLIAAAFVSFFCVFYLIFVRDQRRARRRGLRRCGL